MAKIKCQHCLISFPKLKRPQLELLRYGENMPRPLFDAGCIRGRSASVFSWHTGISVLSAVCGTVSCLTRLTSCRMRNRRENPSLATELRYVDCIMRPLIDSSWRYDRTTSLRFAETFLTKSMVRHCSTQFKDCTASPLYCRVGWWSSPPPSSCPSATNDSLRWRLHGDICTRRIAIT